MGAGDGGTRQRQFKKNNKVFPRKLLIKNMYIYIPADSGQKNICQRRKKKKKEISTLHVHGLSRQSYHDRYVKIDTAYETFFRCFSISGSRFLATVGTLSIRCTNLSWPKRLLLHNLHDFVGCFPFVDADSETSFNCRCCLKEMQ